MIVNNGSEPYSHNLIIAQCKISEKMPLLCRTSRSWMLINVTCDNEVVEVSTINWKILPAERPDMSTLFTQWLLIVMSNKAGPFFFYVDIQKM